ncbi:MAG: VWA domain-containing protein [Microthrixaceae bacterium]|nr:VWA domain-containing protein [Microthrixaceae bacterium]
MAEGDDAQAAVAEAGRRTTSRRDLSRQKGFEQVSPELGVLDADAFDELLAEDTDSALALLGAMTGATDETLRDLARRLAGRVLTDMARQGTARRRGVGRLRRARGEEPGDVDVDASLDAILTARAGGGPLRAEDLAVTTWQRPDTALCLLVDRSGSMQGERLVAAALAAAATLYRHPADCSVVAFSDQAIVLASQGESTATERVIGDLLRLRGHGTTDLGLALRVAHEQLSRSRAARRAAVLLSDCRVTAGGPAVVAAAALTELAIICPAEDRADAEALAAAVGATCVGLAGPTDVPDALAAALANAPR